MPATTGKARTMANNLIKFHYINGNSSVRELPESATVNLLYYCSTKELNKFYSGETITLSNGDAVRLLNVKV